MTSNDIWYVALGFLIGLLTGGGFMMLVLTASMLSSQISQEEENDQ